MDVETLASAAVLYWAAHVAYGLVLVSSKRVRRLVARATSWV